MNPVPNSTFGSPLNQGFCAICRADFHGRTVAETQCGHFVHMDCIHRLLDQREARQRTCTSCQQNPFPIIQRDPPPTPLPEASGVWTRGWNAIVNYFSRSPNANDLFESAIRGNTVTLRSLINRGLHPNAICDSGATPLHMVAELGHVDCLRDMISAGANVNSALAANRTTPLPGMGTPAACKP